MKTCTGCRKILPVSAFARDKHRPGGLSYRCRQCRAAARTPEYARAANLWAKYRLRPEDYDRMLAEQGGTCAICPATTMLRVDHDHACCPGQISCGQCVRGLVCDACNLLLGKANDDAARLRAAATYLENRHAALVRSH